jgi:uncharacterized protein (DUF1330 family)
LHIPAHWLARCKINDPVEYKKHTARVLAIFAKYGDKPPTRNGCCEKEPATLAHFPAKLAH